MGENSLETFLRIVLLPLLERYLAAQGTPMFVGANQFIYWQQFDPTRSVAPDLYVVPGLPPGAEISSIQTWHGRQLVPSFALEVLSTDKEKDYQRAPGKYDELGTQELMIYDPSWASREGGLRWQVYRRVGKRGLVRTEVTQQDRVRSRVLNCWLRAVAQGTGIRLRLATGPQGDTLVPTEAEAERAEKEWERAEKERERAEKERERKERERLEALVAKLSRRRLLMARNLFAAL